MQEKQHDGNIRVENYGLAEWLAEIEQVINQGYKFDFETNANYPQTMGYLFTAILVPKGDEQGVTQVEPEPKPKDDTDVKPKVHAPKRGKLLKAEAVEVQEV